MDADYQPTAKKPRNNLTDKGKNSKFANALNQKKPVFNPGITNYDLCFVLLNIFFLYDYCFFTTLQLRTYFEKYA